MAGRGSNLSDSILIIGTLNMVKEEKMVTVRIAPDFKFDGWNENVAEYKGVLYSYDKGLGKLVVPVGLFKELKSEKPRRFYSLEEYSELKTKPVKEKKAVDVKEDKKVSKAAAKLADVAEDLADDGKRNYSHDPKRKSPGRKKKNK